ncbi:dTDP-4-dehydrorhamnose reductase [Haloarchaeobius sp. HME9146]|uniref:dTDP-4-dehydrorhamnose reductase n=1 Tax=Haloarchaeobius sp. HME9146 TaxID=2978732 RepID=UPI0021C12E0B|nr:dTDP-4-dehydrorhamnose reductase [Haloarchaeobius sp. HME9146]MCT9098193.1 dTDP-4-dehydrorhamnose reductase [Haloarchaeobius sp. HME9146]
MDVLVVGANGLLGSNVVDACFQRDWEVSGTYHSTKPDFDAPLTQFDLEATSWFEEILKEHDPDIVVNCAAMTDVDGCEENPEQARTLNGEAPGRLAEQCEELGSRFVHVSTDYVFDGKAREPYTEGAETNPVQVYGQSKLAGEHAVRDVSEDALIARLSFVYGIHRSREQLTGFPAWVTGQIDDGSNIPLFTDQWVTPTRAGQAADTILELVEEGVSGDYHIASTSCVTPYQFGEAITDILGRGDALLTEGSTEDIDRTATRPTYSCLDVGRVETTLGRSQPTLSEDLKEIRDAL